jgi:poly(A) polymerase
MGVQIEVIAETEEDFRAWDGWVHSRLRQLVMRVEPYVTVRPWPKAYSVPRPPPDDADGLSAPWRCFYFMGLKKKPQPPAPGVKASSVNLNGPVQEFKQQVCCPWAAPMGAAHHEHHPAFLTCCSVVL